MKSTIAILSATLSALALTASNPSKADFMDFVANYAVQRSAKAEDPMTTAIAKTAARLFADHATTRDNYVLASHYIVDTSPLAFLKVDVPTLHFIGVAGQIVPTPETYKVLQRMGTKEHAEPSPAVQAPVPTPVAPVVEAPSLPAPPPQASFDCAKAASKAEILVCSSAHVAALDRELGAVYGRVIHQAPENSKDVLRNGERTWLSAVRDKCEDTACLEHAYRAHIDSLSSIRF